MLTYLNYMSIHMARSIWSSATKDLEKLYNFSTDDIAEINIVNLSFYATFAVILGRFADSPNINLKWFVVFFMALTGLETICYGIFGPT